MDTDEALDNLSKRFKKALNKLPKSPRIFEQTEEQKLETAKGAEKN